MIPLTAWLVLAAVMFAIGLYTVLTRRNALALLLGIELMANAANLNLVAFGAAWETYEGQVMALFGMALTVAEVAVGLAVVIQLYRRHKDIAVNAASELKG